jgi:L-threonylcarbamoyladenylate synthase
MRITLEQAVNMLQKGEVVAIPTETVYGLAANAKNEQALKQIYAIKERPSDNPLIVHIAKIEDVYNWAVEFPELAQKMAKQFWPGPLTIVLNAKPHVSTILTAGQSTVALRIPQHSLALSLLEKSGLALAAPSANKYTQLSPTSPEHVEKGLGEHMPVLAGGECKVGIESTIVHVYQASDTSWQWQLLRVGMVSDVEIAEKIGQCAKQAVFPEVANTKVPGQHLLHYSPRTPLKNFSNRIALIDYVHTLNQQGKSCAALLLGDGEKPNCLVKQLNRNAVQYAEGLYSALHALDALQVDQLLVELPPQESEWIPILDRLTRASA